MTSHLRPRWLIFLPAGWLASVALWPLLMLVLTGISVALGVPAPAVPDIAGPARAMLEAGVAVGVATLVAPSGRGAVALILVTLQILIAIVDSATAKDPLPYPVWSVLGGVAGGVLAARSTAIAAAWSTSLGALLREREPTRDAGMDKPSMASALLGALAANGVLAWIYAVALLAPTTHKEFIAGASTYFLLEFLSLHAATMLRGGTAGASRATLVVLGSVWPRPGDDRPPGRVAAAGLVSVYVVVAAMASIATQNGVPLVMFVASLGAKIIRRRGTDAQETAAGARLGFLFSLLFGAFVLSVILVFGSAYVHLFRDFNEEEWQSQLFVLWGLLYFGSQTVLGALEAVGLAWSAPDRIGQRRDRAWATFRYAAAGFMIALVVLGVVIPTLAFLGLAQMDVPAADQLPSFILDLAALVAIGITTVALYRWHRAAAVGGVCAYAAMLLVGLLIGSQAR